MPPDVENDTEVVQSTSVQTPHNTTITQSSQGDSEEVASSTKVQSTVNEREDAPTSAQRKLNDEELEEVLQSVMLEDIEDGPVLPVE